jgi:hypothetical protein
MTNWVPPNGVGQPHNRNGNIELWTTSADNGFQVLKFAPSLTLRYPALFAKVPTSLSTITVP